MKKNSKKEKNKKLGDRGITLIALIVTIIVLLILAGVSIAVLTGENGILNRATSAKQTHEEKTAEEELRLGISALTIDYRKNTTNAKSFREYVMDNGQALANAMGVNANELTMDSTSYSVTYKGQMYIVNENGGLEPFRVIALTGFNIKETAINVQQGKTKQLTIENKTPSDANEQILWESSNTEVATVDANGVVTGILAGSTTATITATSASGVTSSTSCVVTVTEPTSEILEGVTNRVTYGKYVNYSITKNSSAVELGIGAEGTTDDWKVFYDDGTNIYIIASDYVPVSTLANLNSNYIKEGTTKKTIGEALNIWLGNGTTSYIVYWPNSNFNLTKVGATDIFGTNVAVGTKYLVNERSFLSFWKTPGSSSTSNNAKMTANLMDTEIWSDFAIGCNGSYAIGSPTLSMWIESWNAIYPSDKLYYNNTNSYGYYVGTSPTPSSKYIDASIMSSKSGYNNKLYYPNQDKKGDCGGYWLASPSVGNLGSSEFYVSYNGLINDSNYNYPMYGVRPVVCLPSNVTLNWDSTNNVYNIN